MNLNAVGCVVRGEDIIVVRVEQWIAEETHAVSISSVEPYIVTGPNFSIFLIEITIVS